MEKPSLALETRSVVGKKVKRLRAQGLLPATLYGKGVEALSVQTDEKTFGLLYRQIGRSTLIELTIPGQPNQSAFIHAIQRHPVSRRIIHADLRVVDLKVAITVDVPIRLVGENTAVEKGEATLNQQHATLHIQALPADVPQSIDIDLTELSFGHEVRVRDLTIPAGVTVLTDADDVVVSLTETRGIAAEEEAANAPSEPTLVREERESDDAGE